MRFRHTVQCLAFFSLASHAISSPSPQPEARSLGADKEFDYVVVGGGTAGNVVATRLAQQSFSVALVEAGGVYELTSLQAVPAADVLVAGSDPDNFSPVDWGFVVENQPGTNNRPIHFARGKCLGGSSALNFMIYQRPTIESMQNWADAVNDSSYTFDNALPYYKKSVHFTPPDVEKRAENGTAGFDTDAYDPQGGPLQVSYSNYAMPFSSWMKRGMQAIGIGEIKDFNLGKLMGAQYCSSTINPKNQRRSSSHTFLESIKPSSLSTYTHTLAKKINFDKNKKATSVQVEGPLGTFTLTAKNEIIVSAGAFQSPQLLMVSGIGPAEILREHSIEPVVELPGVGQNMWDHPFVAPTYRVQVSGLTGVAVDFFKIIKNFFGQAFLRRGILSNPVSDFLGWEKIPESLRSSFSESTKKELEKYPDDWPEAEYISGAGYIGNFSSPIFDQPRDGYEYASILAVLITPSSRGNVTLKSTDTNDLPIVNPNFLGTKEDQEVTVAMVKRLRQAFQSDAMAPVTIGEEYNPGPQVQSDDDILEFVKDNLMTLWHPSCTCKMGTPDDPLAVVDNESRVLGVSGLRVVDASAFPFLPPGHPQSTVYMLAEKISDIIIKSGKQQQ